MNKPVLKIEPKKYSGETTVVSLRVARDMLKDLDDAALKSGRNRNEIMTMCLEFALNHMVITEKEENEA